MKKTILLSSLFAVGAAFATTVESGNAVGALDKQISTSDATQILISVPFLGYDGEAVKVAEMVKTSNLDTGSKLYVPDGNGKYNTWKLNASGQWVADKQVVIGADGTPSSEGQSASQGTVGVNRGDAFWLEPVFKNGESSDTIFLLGQGSDAGISTAVKNCWNLIGNASIADKTIEKATIEGKDGDQIIVQVDGLLRYYTYTTDKGWRYKEKGQWKSYPLVIKAGQGFWYKYASTDSEENTKTIHW